MQLCLGLNKQLFWSAELDGRMPEADEEVRQCKQLTIQQHIYLL